MGEPRLKGTQREAQRVSCPGRQLPMCGSICRVSGLILRIAVVSVLVGCTGSDLEIATTDFEARVVEAGGRPQTVLVADARSLNGVRVPGGRILLSHPNDVTGLAPGVCIRAQGPAFVAESLPPQMRADQIEIIRCNGVAR